LKRKRADDGKKKVSQVSSFGALHGVLTRGLSQDNDEDDKDDERRTAQSYYQQQIDLKTDATTNANQPMADEAIFRTRFDHIYEKIKSQNLPQVWRSLFLDVDTFTSSKHNGVSNDDNNDDDDDDDNGRFGRNYWYSTFLESLHPKAEAILSARTAPKYEDLKAIGTSSSGINTFAVYWKGAKTRSESGKQLSYIGSATNATCANPMATRMGQHLAKANQPDKEHSSPFDQIVSTANGEYTLSFATLLTVPVHMVDDVIASCIRILFAEAVISSWLDCYDVNHRSSLISYNAGFWVDGSSPQLHGTLTHSALREGVRGLGVVDDEAARSTMDEHRKAYRQAARRRKYGHRDETEDEKRVRIANGGETDEQRAERKELKRIREKRSRHAARDAYLKQHPPKPRSPMETKRANYERKQAEREALDPQLRIDRLAKAAKKKRERRAERERLNPQLHVDRLAKEAQRYREVQAAKNSSS
jgi:hypothetical protein